MALGRGLESLIDARTLEKNNELIDLDIDAIIPNPDQPRKIFDPEKLEELSRSIKNYGIIEPIIVKKYDGLYIIIAGERRWRAAKELGFTKIPSIVKNDDTNTLELSIIENLQREDLNIVELAQGYKYLIDEYQYSHEDLANKLGVNRSSVTNTLRILNLPETILEMVSKNDISYGNARALLSVKDKKLQKEIANKIKDKKLSVRAVENLIKKELKKPEKPEESKETIFIDNVKNWLSENFDTKVNIKLNKEKGKIEFNFSNYDQLKKIINQFGYKETLI